MIEVAIAVEARKLLAERGTAARVVSVPCVELFLAAPAERRQAVIGEAPVRLAVEPFGYRSVRLDDGPLKRQVDAAREDYLHIPNDDLLKGFRRRALESIRAN